jgi:hypothetical protein
MARSMKEIIKTLDFIEVYNFCFVKDNAKKMRRKTIP